MDAAAAKVTATVERLREQIRRLQAAPREYLTVLRTGIEALDGLLPSGGFVLGEAVELCGEAASGRTSLALRALAAAHREGRLGAYVDGPGELYPPAAVALGVELPKLLIVRPPAPGQLVWSAVQLLRSGAFACVVLDLTHTGVRLGLPEARKLQEAAQRGGSLLLLLTPPDSPADGMIRLMTQAEGVEGLAVEVVRSRRGRLGERTQIPWEALYPAAAPVYRYRVPGERGLAWASASSSSSHSGTRLPERLEVPARQRRGGLPREGCGGVHGFARQRPGRDATRHVLGPLLVAAASNDEGGTSGGRA